MAKILRSSITRLLDKSIVTIGLKGIGAFLLIAASQQVAKHGTDVELASWSSLLQISVISVFLTDFGTYNVGLRSFTSVSPSIPLMKVILLSRLVIGGILCFLVTETIELFSTDFERILVCVSIVIGGLLRWLSLLSIVNGSRILGNLEGLGISLLTGLPIAVSLWGFFGMIHALMCGVVGGRLVLVLGQIIWNRIVIREIILCKVHSGVLDELKSDLCDAVRQGLTALINQLRHHGDLVWFMLGANALSYGVYNNVARIAVLVSFLTPVLVRHYNRILGEAINSGKAHEIRVVWGTMYLHNVLPSLGIALGLLACGNWVLSQFGFDDRYALLVMLLVNQLINVLTSGAHQVLVLTGKSHVALLSGFVATTVLMGSLFFGNLVAEDYALLYLVCDSLDNLFKMIYLKLRSNVYPGLSRSHG